MSATLQAPDPLVGGLEELLARNDLHPVVCAGSRDPNAKIIVLLVPRWGGAARLAVKVPTTDAAAAALRREQHQLEALGRLPLDPIRATVPEVVGSVAVGGRCALVTTAVPGTSMRTSYHSWGHTRSRRRVAADLAAVGDWLSDLQRLSAGARAPIDLVSGHRPRLRQRFAGDPVLAALLQRLTAVDRRLAAESCPRTVVHGDLWSGNVLVRDQRVSGVVDWEEGSPVGEPLRDLVHFALTYALYLDRHTVPGHRVAGHVGLRARFWGEPVVYAIRGEGWFPDLFRCFLRRGLERLGVSPERWCDAAIAGLVEIAATADHDTFARDHLHLLARLLLDHPDARGAPT